jgi:hypothetical protein
VHRAEKLQKIVCVKPFPVLLTTAITVWTHCSCLETLALKLAGMGRCQIMEP